jgi:hypothetical protein
LALFHLKRLNSALDSLTKLVADETSKRVLFLSLSLSLSLLCYHYVDIELIEWLLLCGGNF